MRGLTRVPLLPLLLAASAALAAPPADPDLLLPPAVTPAPAPTPGQTVKLAKGQFYVVKAKAPQYLKTRGTGKVTVKTRDGSKTPLKLLAAAVIGWPADPPTPAPKPDPVDPDFPLPTPPAPPPVVTFADPYLYVIQAEATGPVELEISPRLNRLDSAGKPIPLADADFVYVSIDVDAGQGPQPPPNPIDPPKPAPAGTGTWAVVVVDDLTPNPAAAKVIDGPTFRALKAAGKCRVYGTAGDASVLSAKNYGPLVTKAGGPPALLVLSKDGHEVWVGKLPADEATAAAKVKEVMAP